MNAECGTELCGKLPGFASHPRQLNVHSSPIVWIAIPNMGLSKKIPASCFNLPWAAHSVMFFVLARVEGCNYGVIV